MNYGDIVLYSEHLRPLHCFLIYLQHAIPIQKVYVQTTRMESAEVFVFSIPGTEGSL